MDPQELVPLEAGQQPQPKKRHVKQCHIASRSCYRVPLRLFRLVLLLILLPTLFIMVPLYMRYKVFLGQMYPMSMTDMRLIDSKISTTWCQRQVVRSNATFNAFVVPGHPELSQELVPVSMTRELELEDDMKEYWGFYLLKGSSVTVSACTRWPGSSLIMIKGYKHLQECAYIGDDSSEEIDELNEAFERGLINDTIRRQKMEQIKKVDGKANQPDTMRRQKAGVKFHDPTKVENVTSAENVPNLDVTDHDPKELREILEHLHAIRQAAKDERAKFYHPPDHLMQLPALHRHRDANVDKEERKWLSFQNLDGKNSEMFDDRSRDTGFITTEAQTDKPTANVESKNKEIKPITFMKHNSIETTSIRNLETTTEPKIVEIKDIGSEYNENSIEKNNNGILKEQKKQKEDRKVNKARKSKEAITDRIPNIEVTEVTTKYTTTTEIPEENSKEVFEDVLKRLQALGERGKRVLAKLHKTMGVDYNEQEPKKSDIMKIIQGSSAELDHLRQVLVEAIDEEKTKPQRQQKRKESMLEARAKRELMLGQIELTKQLNEDDEGRNYAVEEDFRPDDLADHHEIVNETSPLDMSNSEFWSSFSSSEEALLECDGLILNLPLTPHGGCRADATEEESFAAARANALTYRVPANGYYFFVFNSENEVQRNFIRARFDLQKTRYDIARSKLRECTNSTERCDLNLDIFSSQKVVLELPLRNNDSLWNEQFVIISECEPRTSVYIFCVIAVPILILVFGLQ